MAKLTGVLGTLEEIAKASKEADALIAADKARRATPKMSKAQLVEAGYYHPIGVNKLPMPVSEMSRTVIPDTKFTAQPTKYLTPMDLYKKTGIPLIGDRADAGHILTHVNENALPEGVELGGGRYFGKYNTFPEQPEKSSAWASDKKVVNALSNQVKRAAMSGSDVLGINVLGSPTNVNFNNMVTRTLFGQLDFSALNCPVLSTGFRSDLGASLEGNPKAAYSSSVRSSAPIIPGSSTPCA